MITKEIQTLENFKNKLFIKGHAVLFHGSREGIQGRIEPKNRPRKNGECDFGKGFYMGTNEDQAEGLIYEKKNKNPIVYTVDLDISSIPKDRILFLEDSEWLYTVMAFRSDDELDDFHNTECAREYRDKTKNYDLIIGLIADDRIQMAMESFMNNSLSDAGLFACLKYIDYGFQVVAKTQKACDCITITDKHSLFGATRQQAAIKAGKQLEKCISIVDQMRVKYRKEGKLYDEILEELLLQGKKRGE